MLRPWVASGQDTPLLWPPVRDGVDDELVAPIYSVPFVIRNEKLAAVTAQPISGGHFDQRT